MADVQTFFGQMMPDALNRGFESFEKKVAAAEEAGAANAAQLRAALDGMRSVEATLVFEVTGEGGANFYYNQKQGRVAVGDQAAVEPMVIIGQTLVDFDALQEAGATPVIGGGGGGGGGSARLFRPAFIDAVALLNKVLKLVINEVPGHGDTTTWIRLGKNASQPEPDVTLSVSLGTYQDMTAGRIPPPAAFMQGLLKIEGDLALLMQIGQLAMSQ